MKREIEEDLEVPSEESDYESEDGVDGMQRMLEDEMAYANYFPQILTLPLSSLASCISTARRHGTTYC
jgi:hypothetical protein